MNRKEFPALARCHHLANGSTGILPRSAVRAMHRAALHYSEVGEIEKREWEGMLCDVRALAARLFGGSQSDWACVPNTTHGAFTALYTTEWREGDNVLFPEGGFPANRSVWLNCPPSCVERRSVSRETFAINPSAATSLINERTRIIAVDHVQYDTGERTEPAPLAEAVHDVGGVLFVDGVQALGCVHLDVPSTGADVYAAGGTKWLFGPQGTGLMYVSPRFRERAGERFTGWLSAEYDDAWSGLDRTRPPSPDARRYEQASRNIVGFYGLRECLRLLEGVGMEQVWRRVSTLCALLRQGLEERGCRIVTPSGHSGIVTFVPPGDAAETREKLQRADVVVSLRQGMLRAAPHFYNDEGDVEALLAAL